MRNVIESERKRKKIRRSVKRKFTWTIFDSLKLHMEETATYAIPPEARDFTLLTSA